MIVGLIIPSSGHSWHSLGHFGSFSAVPILMTGSKRESACGFVTVFGWIVQPLLRLIEDLKIQSTPGR